MLEARNRIYDFLSMEKQSDRGKAMSDTYLKTAFPKLDAKSEKI